jgi:hypothetical protein
MPGLCRSNLTGIDKAFHLNLAAERAGIKNKEDQGSGIRDQLQDQGSGNLTTLGLNLTAARSGMCMKIQNSKTNFC